MINISTYTLPPTIMVQWKMGVSPILLSFHSLTNFLLNPPDLWKKKTRWFVKHLLSRSFFHFFHFITQGVWTSKVRYFTTLGYPFPPSSPPVHKVLSCGPLDLRDEIPGKGFSFTRFFLGGELRRYAVILFFLNGIVFPWKQNAQLNILQEPLSKEFSFFQMSYENTHDIVVCFFCPAGEVKHLGISHIVCIPLFPHPKKIEG